MHVTFMPSRTPGKEGNWHELRDHLIEVANLATVFASSFHMEGYACLAAFFTIWERPYRNFKDIFRPK